MKSTLSKVGGVFGHKPKPDRKFEVPGPGTYESPSKKTNKGASFGVGPKFDTSLE